MSLRNINPQLGPLQNNGGPTLTHALLPNSPAINTGNPTFAPPPATDQRGVGFPRVQQARIDIGAFESTFAAPDPLPAATVCARLLLPFVSR